MTQKYIAAGHEYFVDKGINSNPRRMGGLPCIEGTRIPVRMVKMWTRKEILSNWPYLTQEQVDNAIRYWEVRGVKKIR
jgi:uncharacterized protein (DUF433 family)